MYIDVYTFNGTESFALHLLYWILHANAVQHAYGDACLLASYGLGSQCSERWYGAA